MKFGITKTFTVLLVTIVMLSLPASRSYGQARPSPKENVISVDPLGLAYHDPLTFQYEYKSGPVNSWVFRLHYWPTYFEADDWSAFGLGAAYRFYIADSRALTGLSVEPAADLYFFKGANSGRSAIVFWIGGGIAYKWIFDDFALEPMLGFRIGFGSQVAPGFATGAQGILALNAGYAW